MDGFYEWAQNKSPKQPFAVALRSVAPMALAGLLEGWQQTDGNWLKTYGVITCAAAGRQALLHPRMPVILPEAAWATWLGETPAHDPDLAHLLGKRIPRFLAHRPKDRARCGKRCSFADAECDGFDRRVESPSRSSSGSGRELKRNQSLR